MELASAIGITKAGVSKIENGGGASNEIRSKINRVLGISIPLKPIKEPHIKLKDKIKNLEKQIEQLQEEKDELGKSIVDIVGTSFEKLTEAQQENNRLKGLLKETAIRFHLDIMTAGKARLGVNLEELFNEWLEKNKIKL